MLKIKRIAIILILLTVTVHILPELYFFEVKATSQSENKLTQDETIKEFMSIIKNTVQYSEFESKINEVEVMEYSSTNVGDRITISFTTDRENQRIIFVGSETYEILYIGLITDGEDVLEVFDLLQSKKISYSYTSLSSISPDPNCSTYYCTSYQSNYVWNPQPACSIIIGQGCYGFALLPGYGWVAYAVCRAGVFIGCNFYTNKKCTTGFWNNVCPM